MKDNLSHPRSIVVQRILTAIGGAIAGAVVGLVSALFTATVSGGDNDLMVAFLAISFMPGGLVVGIILGAVAGVLLNRYPHKANSVRHKIILAGLIVVLPATVGGMLWIINTRGIPPSDRRLLADFERHEKIFNQLVEMIKSDKDLTRVDVDWTNPKDLNTIGVSPERIELYRRLLKEAHVPRGFQTQRADEEINFFYWGVGSAISDDISKGYAYLTSPPIRTLPTLDGFRRTPEDDGWVRVYRHIRGNWYLFYEYIEG